MRIVHAWWKRKIMRELMERKESDASIVEIPFKWKCFVDKFKYCCAVSICLYLILHVYVLNMSGIANECADKCQVLLEEWIALCSLIRKIKEVL